MRELRARLNVLRAQRGDQCTSSSLASTEPLRAKLDRLHARPVRNGRVNAGRDDAGLAELLGGELIAPGLVRVEREVPSGTRQGRVEMRALELTGALARFAPQSSACVPVFMDTETTGLAGGTGTVVFVIGLARKSRDGLMLTQLVLTKFEAEAAMLQVARSVVDGADALVSFNGKTFDRPLLSTRYRLCAERDPFVELQHVDVLHIVRRAFGDRWPDCRMRTVEERLLGFERIDDLPGAEAPEAWFRWIRNGDPANLARVLTHNRLDVVSVCAALQVLEQCYDDPLAFDASTSACLRAGDAARDEVHCYDYLRAHRARLDVSAALELARLARRRDDWNLALDIWGELSRRGELEAIERLAKYHEHIARDLRRALEFATTLLALEPERHAHRHRERRLLRKLTKAYATPAPRDGEGESAARECF